MLQARIAAIAGILLLGVWAAQGITCDRISAGMNAKNMVCDNATKCMITFTMTSSVPPGMSQCFKVGDVHVSVTPSKMVTYASTHDPDEYICRPMLPEDPPSTSCYNGLTEGIWGKVIGLQQGVSKACRGYSPGITLCDAHAGLGLSDRWPQRCNNSGQYIQLRSCRNDCGVRTTHFFAWYCQKQVSYVVRKVRSTSYYLDFDTVASNPDGTSNLTIKDAVATSALGVPSSYFNGWTIITDTDTGKSYCRAEAVHPGDPADYCATIWDPSSGIFVATRELATVSGDCHQVIGLTRFSVTWDHFRYEGAQRPLPCYSPDGSQVLSTTGVTAMITTPVMLTSSIVIEAGMDAVGIYTHCDVGKFEYRLILGDCKQTDVLESRTGCILMARSDECTVVPVSYSDEVQKWSIQNPSNVSMCMVVISNSSSEVAINISITQGFCGNLPIAPHHPTDSPNRNTNTNRIDWTKILSILGGVLAGVVGLSLLYCILAKCCGGALPMCLPCCCQSANSNLHAGERAPANHTVINVLTRKESNASGYSYGVV